MIKENVKVDTGNIVTYRRSKKTNDILYFSHANGFCGQAYTDLLDKIDSSYEVITYDICLLYTSPSPRDRIASRMPSSA